MLFQSVLANYSGLLPGKGFAERDKFITRGSGQSCGTNHPIEMEVITAVRPHSVRLKLYAQVSSTQTLRLPMPGILPYLIPLRENAGFSLNSEIVGNSLNGN